MVAFPPKYRTFIKSSNGIKANLIPSPIGFSLVTDGYTKMVTFYENINNDPVFCNWRKIERDFTTALEYYYPFTGRLISSGNGHYDIGNFEKGALFEVVDSADSMSDYKKCNFSFTGVPFKELIPIDLYVSRDCPILAIKVTILKDGGFAIGYSLHHKLADGRCIAEFIKLFCRISKGETISKNEIAFYTDSDREPCRPLDGMDPTTIYPRIPFKERAPPNVPFKGPYKRLVFSLSKENEIQLKKDVLEEACKQGAKISRFNIFMSLIQKAMTKARLLDENIPADLLCVVANHHNCKDKNMMKYLGNYVMFVTVPNTVRDVNNKSVYDLALELRSKVAEATVPYMESLEYYLNNHKHVQEIMSPMYRTRYGPIAVTDWSKFTDRFDFGCGPCIRFRISVDLSPMPLLTVTTGSVGELEAVIQLDPESMDRLQRDNNFMKYISAVN